MNLIVLTEAEAKTQGLIELLEYTPPNYKLDTQYGMVSARNWMVYELERITQSPNRVARLVEKGGLVSLWVDDAASKKVN